MEHWSCSPGEADALEHRLQHGLANPLPEPKEYRAVHGPRNPKTPAAPEKPRRPRCFCGSRIQTTDDLCSRCRAMNENSRRYDPERCKCGKRKWFGRPTCSVCRQQSRNPRRIRSWELILQLLETGPKTRPEIQRELGMAQTTVYWTLLRLIKEDRVTKTDQAVPQFRIKSDS